MGNIIVGPTIPRYTEGEMRRIATKRGYRAEARLFDDWCDHGLLDNPPRAGGLGRGKGSMPRKWSEQQRELWLCLLEFRQRRKIGHLQPLYAIPVYSWLYWGDAGGVPLRQVRRAIASWARDVRIPRSSEQTRRDVTKLVRTTRSTHAKGEHREVVSGLTDLLTSGRLYNDATAREDLKYLLQITIDPTGKGEFKGHPVAPLTAQAATALITARLEALMNIEQTPEWMWEWARAMQLISVFDFQAKSSDYQANPAWRQLYASHTTAQDLVNDACSDLLTVIGIARQMLSEKSDMNHLPRPLQPSLWQQGLMSITINTRMSTSQLILPYDLRAMGDCLEVSFSIQEKPRRV